MPKNSELVVLRSLLTDDFLAQPIAPTDEDLLEIITAKEAASLLREGKSLARKRIRGDLILGQEGLRYSLETELEGRKVILGGVSAPPQLERVPFGSEIEVRECLFEGKVQLAGIWFEKAITFSGTTFQANAEFHYSVFAKPAIFRQCRFEENAKFGDAYFYERVHFDHTIFDRRSDFYNVVFQDGASFSNTIFRDDCNFSQNWFKTSEIVRPCLDFRNSVCHEAAYLAGSKFDGIAEFTDAQFRQQADFSGSIFYYVNFTKTRFARLDLKWEQISGKKLLFGETALPGSLKPVIELGDFDELFKRREDAPLSDKHRQYDILKELFTKQGDHVSADGCYYEWKQVERRQSRLGINPERWMIKGFHYLNWLSCGYGIKPMRTLLFGLVTIILFAIAYTILDPAISDLHGGTVNTLQTSTALLLYRKLGLSFLSFMSFGSIQSGLNPVAELLYWIERLLGWLTLILFVTTYRRLMER